MDNKAISYIFGTAGAVCWSVQLLPQIYLNWRRGNATGLKPGFMMFWAWAGVALGIYNIVSDFNIALRVQPQILAFLSLATWCQVLYYESRWSAIRTLTVAIPMAGVMAGIETGLVFTLRHGVSRGVDWPLTLMAVLAALFLALGVMEQYIDIWRHRGVRGISFVFCGIDAMGDLTSIISVIFQPSLNVLGLVIYGVELALWAGIFACGGYYNLIPWVKRWSERRRLGDAPSTEEDAAQDTNAVALHDMPLSTSVFRTPSGALATRSRAHGATTHISDLEDQA